MKRSCRLYLVRHGQVMGYDRRPVYGHTDVGITEVGRLQMEALAERLKYVPIKAVFSSDLERSRLGALIIGRHHDVPVQSLPELREMNFGDWESLTLGELSERFPEELQKRKADLLGYRIPGGGESVEDFARRVLGCLDGILAERDGEDVLLVAHGGVNRVILCSAMGLAMDRIFSLHQDYGCLNIIDYFQDGALIRLVNG
ncbi:MAG: alpha-ribazole phosphatase [Desulfobacteraceae bacterium]